MPTFVFGAFYSELKVLRTHVDQLNATKDSERRKGLRKNPDNRHGHRKADTYCTAKHHHEI
jgi:hypothetical protein